MNRERVGYSRLETSMPVWCLNEHSKSEIQVLPVLTGHSNCYE